MVSHFLLYIRIIYFPFFHKCLPKDLMSLYLHELNQIDLELGETNLSHFRI